MHMDFSHSMAARSGGESLKADTEVISRLMLKMLPIQAMMAAVSAVNILISTFFASNCVGVDAMSAVGLYGPISILITAICTMLQGGSVILSGRYLGQNKYKKLQNVFSMNLTLSALTAAVLTVLFLLGGLLDLTGFLTSDGMVRPLFNRYLLGQAIGLFPLVLSNQLSAFLTLENKGKQILTANIIFIAVNLALNYLLVYRMRQGVFGLALASSLGMWVYLGAEAQHYLSGRSVLRMRLTLDWGDAGAVLRIGYPGALSNGYQTIRSLAVNWMITLAVGSVGISAFAAANNVMSIFWSLPTGMLAVSRLLMSVSIGEEDRQSLTDVMRVMFKRFIPIMCVVCAGIILCAVPLTRIFFHDPDAPVFGMTVWGFRILPLCMPFSIICIHFVCYGQASGKQFLVHLLSVLDGVVCVTGYTALLIRALGLNSVYIANVLNGVTTTLVIIGYAWRKKRAFPRTMDELMVIPQEFGAPESERMDLSIKTMEDVVSIAEQVQLFCLERGIDRRRSYLAGLAMEEMAGNIVDHGFTKDSKRHSVDVRVMHKDDIVLMRIRDNCESFDPGRRLKMTKDGDIVKNIGIRMIFGMAQDVNYQNILGLNVLTIRI